MSNTVQIQAMPSGFGSYLSTILPEDIAVACGAFSTSMMQIKNITRVPIEKFAQVAGSLETTKGLDVNGTTVPTDTSLATAAKNSLALGSGPHGTYTMGDFFGAMSGTPYNYKNIESTINSIDTAALAATYASMVALLSGAGPYDVALQALITTANNDIIACNAVQPTECAQLNTIWNALGTQLAIEQAARDLGLGISSSSNKEASSPSTQLSFVDMIGQYARNVRPHMAAQTLEAISDWNTVGGQSIIAMMRQTRNQDRLAEAGIPLDNNIPSELTSTEEKTLIANGDSNLYTPSTATDPQAWGYYRATNDDYVITDPNYGGPLTNTPLDTGLAEVPGSLAGSKYSNLVPPNLNGVYASKQLSASSYTVAEAQTEVEHCNCDCW